MEIKLESTSGIQEANELVISLRNALPKILSQKWYVRKVPMSEKVIFLRELAAAKRNLWQNVELTYPQVKGKIYSISSLNVTYEDGILPEAPKEH